MQTKPPTDPALAEIRAGLARRSLTHTDLAKALGISRTAVHRRLSGDVDFSLNELRTTAQLIHVPIADIVNAAALVEGGDAA